MNQATFYILDKNSHYDRYLFACKLVEKAFHQKLSIGIIASNEQAHQIDDLLWSFKAESFIPHDLTVLESSSNTGLICVPSEIKTNVEDKSTAFDITINLTQQPCSPAVPSNRHIEIAIQDPVMLKQLRADYKKYQSDAIPIEVHDFSKKRRQ